METAFRSRVFNFPNDSRLAILNFRNYGDSADCQSIKRKNYPTMSPNSSAVSSKGIIDVVFGVIPDRAQLGHACQRSVANQIMVHLSVFLRCSRQSRSTASKTSDVNNPAAAASRAMSSDKEIWTFFMRAY